MWFNSSASIEGYSCRCDMQRSEVTSEVQGSYLGQISGPGDAAWELLTLNAKPPF